MAVRVLLMLTAFALLYGCGQASSPVERQEKQGGVEEAKPKEPNEPTEQAGARAFTGTYKCEDFHSREAAQEYLDTTRLSDAERKVIDPDDNDRACDEGAYLFASDRTTASTTATASAGGLSMSPEEQAAQSEANCRLAAYVSNENLSQQEGSAFSEKIANQMYEKMQDDPSLTAGPAENQVLDDLDVPRYPECKMGDE